MWLVANVYITGGGGGGRLDKEYSCTAYEPGGSGGLQFPRWEVF